MDFYLVPGPGCAVKFEKGVIFYVFGLSFKSDPPLAVRNDGYPVLEPFHLSIILFHIDGENDMVIFHALFGLEPTREFVLEFCK